MRKCAEAARAVILKENCSDPRCHNLELNVDLSLPICHNMRVPQVTPGYQRALCMADYNSCGGPLIPAHVAVKYGILPIDDDSILVSVYPRCGVISENVISLCWRPFWKWHYIGSPSQFSGGGIDFSCWDKSQWPNGIALVSYVPGWCMWGILPVLDPLTN